MILDLKPATPCHYLATRMSPIIHTGQKHWSFSFSVIGNPSQQYCFAHNHRFEVVFSSSHFDSPAFFSSSLKLEYWGRVWAFLCRSPAGMPGRLALAWVQGEFIIFILISVYTCYFYVHLCVKNFPNCRTSLWML